VCPSTLAQRQYRGEPPVLAARQHGAVTVARLPASGIDHAAIARRVDAGILHRIHRGVYAVGHAGLSFLERALALHRDGSAGTKSGLEDAFLARLPPWAEEPRVNTALLGIEVDFLWPRGRLVVEVDGPGHGRPRTLREDAGKQRKLEEAGYAVIRVSDPASDMAHVEVSLTRRQ
jgi:Transcriptional regulator, AbiEi antitoxin/Protein of unknown function (DUF559)